MVIIYRYVDLQYNDLPAKDQVLLAAVVCFGDVTLRNVLLYIANLFFVPIILMPMLELMIMFAPFIFIRDEE